MHILQPKHIRLKPEEVKKLLARYNISVSQLPVIKADDPALHGEYIKGDVVRIIRKEGDKIVVVYRVVV